MRIFLSALALSTCTAFAFAQDAIKITPEMLAKAVAGSWQGVPPELKPRIEQDEAMALCSQYRNDVPKDIADKLIAVAKASVVYPPDNKLMGDWRKGEAGSLSGHGLRMGDDPRRPVGGNCYACHEMAPKELSAGTLGPSLKGYGKLKGNSAQTQKEVYEKIFNAQTVLACSNMPRFGANKMLKPEEIADYVAFLLDPDSPVNKD